MNVFKLKNKYVVHLSFKEQQMLQEVIEQSFAELGTRECELFAVHMTEVFKIADQHGGYTE